MELVVKESNYKQHLSPECLQINYSYKTIAIVNIKTISYKTRTVILMNISSLFYYICLYINQLFLPLYSPPPSP